MGSLGTENSESPTGTKPTTFQITGWRALQLSYGRPNRTHITQGKNIMDFWFHVQHHIRCKKPTCHHGAVEVCWEVVMEV